MKPFSSDYLFMTGPCSLESREQMEAFVPFFKKWNLKYLRAPIFKPRTHPDSFQGIGEAGIPILEYLKAQGFELVIEVCSTEQLKVALPFASILQIGARNMQNYEFLKSIGPVLKHQNSKAMVMLKRGFGNTYEEWLNCALYLEKYGVPQDSIILCERGTKNHCSPSGVTLDFGIALKAKQETHYKVILDPSHGSSDDRLVLPLTQAILKMNFDGVMIESHPRPKQSVSDAHQAISIQDLERFLEDLA
jgi:3-deoxy-7-phosphoheptulonate synthase